jgi:PAS domain S-box-containing protein
MAERKMKRPGKPPRRAASKGSLPKEGHRAADAAEGRAPSHAAEADLRVAETAALVAASRAILESRLFKDAARAVFDSCKGLIGARAGYVALLSADGSENEVVFLDAGGLPCSVDPSLPMPIRGLRAEAYRTHKAVFENDFADSPWTEFMPPGHAQLENVLFAPLTIDRKVVGLLGLANKPGGFTAHDVRLASAFGELAAIALSNSRTQEALIRAKDEWERTFDAVPDLVAILDGRHHVVRVNRAMANRLGVRPEDAVGLPCYRCVHGAKDPPPFCPHSQLLADGKEHTAEVHEPRLGGYFMVSVSPLRDAEGRVIGSVHVAHDITERKLAEEKIRKARDDLEVRVQVRTAELEEANIALQDEVTVRNEAEKALRESNELLETMFSSIDLLVAYMDKDFNFIRVNRAYAAADGHEPEHYVGKNHFALFPNDENEAIFRSVVETGRPFFTYDKPFTYAADPERGVSYWDWSLQPVHDADGRAAGVVLSLLNVTDRRLAQQQLEAERHRLFSVLNMLPGFIVVVQPDHSVAFVNQTFRETFGEPVGRHCYEVLCGRHRPCGDCHVRSILAHGEAQEWQWTDPRGRTFQTWGYPFVESDGTMSVLKVGIDISERKELEREILQVSSDERHRIGQDLHDVLGQNLTGISFLSKVLAKRLKDNGAPEAEQAEQISELVSRSVAQTRAISHGLCPVALKEEGLMEALREMASRIESLFGIPCRFDCGEAIPVSDGTAATNLYHIAQEAVNNASKHAKATHLRIRLGRANGAVVLAVEDDGIGLPEAPGASGGMGLRIMQYRADLIGALLKIERSDGGGTRVVCSLPEGRE